MSRKNGQIYEFAEFRLIPAENLLLRDGQSVPIKPKVFSALVYLVERNGHLVEKGELMDRVWEDAFVEEAAVARCVWAIRNALGEGSENRKFIQTVPKRGYRFVGNVTEVNGAGPDGPHAEPEVLSPIVNGNVLPLTRPNGKSMTAARPARESENIVVSFPVLDEAAETPTNSEITPAAIKGQASRLRAKYLAFGLLTGLFVLSIGTYYFFTRTPATAGTDGSRIAVLPLRPINADNRDPIFEFAIAESLILKLSSDKNLIVRPLSAVRRYIELDTDPIDAGRELKADFVLSSNYQLVNGRIRVTSQLLNIHTGQTEDTFKSESDAADAFSMQDAVANEIGNAMFARLGHKQTEYIAKRGTVSEEAYRLYLQGQYLVDKKTRSDAKRAIEIFDEALRLDPNYAHAWAGKAAAHCTFAHMGGIEPKLAFTTAKPALRKAFELDPNLAEAHAVRGIISFDFDWEFKSGLEHFRKALELNPHHEMARRWYANRLALMGRYDEALTEIKTLIDINPSGIFQQWDLANILYQSRRYDEAVVQLHRLLEMDPNMAWAPKLIWVSYHMKGDHEQAYTWFMKFQEKRKTDPAELEVYKKTYETSGWPGVLVKHSEILQTRYKNDEYDPTSGEILLVASLVGDKDTAFKFANNGIKYRDLWVPYLLSDPAFDSLRNDPRFNLLLRRAGL